MLFRDMPARVVIMRASPGREITAEELACWARPWISPTVLLLAPFGGDEALQILPGDMIASPDGAVWLAAQALRIT